MYEGADDSIETPMDSMEACCSLENCCVDSEDLAKLADAASADGASQEAKETCCFDPGASLDSADVQLSSSHEEHALESHLRNRRRQQSRQQKQSQQQLQMNNDCRRVVAETGKTFIPFSEETMFCDSDNTPAHSATQTAATVTGNVDTSSPVSSDSWMNYSSHSSDDYSFLMDPNRSTGRSRGSLASSDVRGDVSDRDSVESASIVPRNKRNRDSFKFRKEDSVDEEDTENIIPSRHDSVEEGETSRDPEDNTEDEDNESVDETLAHLHLQINQPKRLRGKEPENGVVSNGGGSSAAGNVRSGGKSVNSSRRSSTNTNSQQLVDIRIIDFAHTAFVKKNSGSGAAMIAPQQEGEAAATAVHKGPDCGFITGLDSLKRLLQEILPDGGGLADASTLDLMQ